MIDSRSNLATDAFLSPDIMPDNGEARLHAVHRYGVLDTAPDEALDRLARRAVRLLRVPAAGLPSGLDSARSRGRGMKVIAAVVNALKDRWSADRKAAGAGAMFSITFPKS